ncbi:hypothetical protein [Mycobacteroides abscessus]|uniref:hypothetical protein n=1 Tax=Mycobacteroides abscessus TaxID=36809 RepID=UPI001928E470|nr:hypothetical protein [Mycobacteroides abscessus]MBL3753033.1 hypothetical protein [Mycobacteroides abscessus subsp. massiliense]
MTTNNLKPLVGKFFNLFEVCPNGHLSDWLDSGEILASLGDRVLIAPGDEPQRLMLASSLIGLGGTRKAYFFDTEEARQLQWDAWKRLPVCGAVCDR